MLTNIHLRGLDSQLMAKLKQAADKKHLSMNKFILTLLRQGVGLDVERKLAIYHDLDQLAGTWSSQEAKTFLRNTADFEQIDEEIWK